MRGFGETCSDSGRILNTRPTGKQNTEYSTCRIVTVRPNNEYLSGQIQSLKILKRLI